MIVTQTRRRRRGSLDLFRLRAGLDRMRKKWNKVQVQVMPRTFGPLLPGELSEPRAQLSPANIRVIHVKPVHQFNDFTDVN